MKYKKIVLNSNKKYYWKSGDIHLNEGILKEEDIKSKSTIETSKGKIFKSLPANFLDNTEKIIRGPQIPLQKDIATIIHYSSLTKDSKVLEAGSGSGLLTINLARFAKKVISYEKNKSNFQIAEKNIKNLDLKNVKLVNKDISEAKEKDFDTIILDLLEPEKTLNKLKDKIISGGTLIVYLPNLTQVFDLKSSLKENDFIHIKTLETIEREWDIHKLISKPKSTSLHSAFIVICRKL